MLAADLILKNANVITMNHAQPRAGLVAVSGKQVIFVGTNEDLASVSGLKTKVIDCQGKTVLPGFNDAHCHIISLIRRLYSLDLSPPVVSSINDIKAVIKQRVQNTPPGQWIIGTDFNEFYLAERRFPTRWDLDEVAPHHPVIVSHRSLHACVLNSLALSLAGITVGTVEPVGGVIERESNTGEPNGVLFEMLGYIREKVIPPLSEERLAKGIALASEHYLAYGITSLQEATISNNLKRWQMYSRFKETGQLKSRVYMMFGSDALDQFLEAGLVPGSGDDQLRLGGVKIILSKISGQLQPGQQELNHRAFDIHKAGFQLALHGVEQSTVAAAATVLEYVNGQLPQPRRRHRIEHCSECPPQLLKRLGKLKAVIVTQPPFLYYSGERYLATVPKSQQPWLYRIKSFLDAGLLVAGSSDSPVVPNNPLTGIYAAITRQTESGQRVLPHESIHIKQALALYTKNAAYASFEEKIKGSITPGRLADMVVLSHDPIKSPVEQVKDIKAEMTIVGGEIVWQA